MVVVREGEGGGGYTGDESPLSLSGVLAALEEGEELVKAGDLDRVETVKEAAGQEAGDAHDGRRHDAPWQIRILGGGWEWGRHGFLPVVALPVHLYEPRTKVSTHGRCVGCCGWK